MMNNPFDLLKETPDQKEIVRAKVVSVDALGRMLCKTANGTFRASGVIKKGSFQRVAIFSNSGQRQAEFHLLQPYSKIKE
mgnify:CR=1 FL=1